MRIIAVAMLLAGVSSITATAGDIVIGLVLPPSESEARCIQQGAQLAVDEFNQRAHGESVRLAVRGASGQWGTAAGEAGQLISEDGAIALIAPTDGAVTHLVLQVAGKTGVPVISLSPDSSVTTSGVLNVVRMVTDRVTETAFVFSHGRDGQLKRPLRWSAIVPSGRAGRECAADITKAAASAHIELAASVEVEDVSRSGIDLLQRLGADRPEAVFIAHDAATSVQLAIQLRQAGFTGLLAGPSQLYSHAFAPKAAAALEGFMVAMPVAFPASSFAGAYEKRFNEKPDFVAGLSYDATSFLAQNLAKLQSAEARAQSLVTGTSNGATGEIAFDAHGNRVAALQMHVWRTNQFVPVKQLQPHGSDRQHGAIP